MPVGRWPSRHIRDSKQKSNVLSTETLPPPPNCICIRAGQWGIGLHVGGFLTWKKPTFLLSSLHVVQISGIGLSAQGL